MIKEVPFQCTALPESWRKERVKGADGPGWTRVDMVVMSQRPVTLGLEAVEEPREGPLGAGLLSLPGRGASWSLGWMGAQCWGGIWAACRKSCQDKEHALTSCQASMNRNFRSLVLAGKNDLSVENLKPREGSKSKSHLARTSDQTSSHSEGSDPCLRAL